MAKQVASYQGVVFRFKRLPPCFGILDFMVDALVKVYVEGGLVQTRRDSRVLNIGSESLMAYVGMVVGAGRRIAVKALEMKLRKARATSASNAVAPEEAGITSERELGWIDHLVKQDKIVKTEDGKIRWKE